MEGKYIDYLLPQLYWSIDHKTASYAKLIKWWAENSTNTNVYIGNGSYKIKSDSDKKWDNPSEIPNQIDLTRTYTNIQGNAFFSAKAFVNKNQDVTKILSENQYKYPAIPLPVTSSVKTTNERPLIQTFAKEENAYQFSFQKTQTDQIRYIVVYSANNETKLDCNDPSQIIEKVFINAKSESIKCIITIEKIKNAKKIAFTFIDFYGNESVPEIFNLHTEIKQN
jgi:hypothetical protein